MIEFMDQGVSSAAAQATGHAAPFDAGELAGITTLRVRHARDLSELRRCTGLTALELTASAVTTLDVVADLPQLRRLHVLACPIEDAGALAGHPELIDVRLDFGFLQDLRPLTTIVNLRHGRFVGNPIDPTSWHDVRPAWRRSRLTPSGRPRLLEFGPTAAWDYTRQAWEHGVRIGCGLLDGLRPVLVRPGIPATAEVTVDAIHGFGAAVLVAAQRGESTDEIFRRNREWADGEGFARPTDFTSHRALGDAADARGWLAEAPGEDRAALERFVAHFPDDVFFREDEVSQRSIQSATMPAPVAASRRVLAGLLLEDSARFRLAALAGSPRADRVAEIWYLPSPGVYSTDEQEALLRDQAGLFPLAEWIETGQSFLAARLGPDDPAIYEFGVPDLHDTRSLGQPLAESVYRVFASHAELLARIGAYRYPDGGEVPAVTTADEWGR